MMVKGIAKLVVKDYNNYTNTNVANMKLVDQQGKNQSFGGLYAGKTVYLYVWEDKKLTTEELKSNGLLKERFAKYPDVVFANLYIGSDTVSNAYRLGTDDASAVLKKTLNVGNPAPFIIGQNGTILAYKGPKANDKILVDYVLYEARIGENGTKAAKRLIKGVNKRQQFKTDKLRNWYRNHFGQSPDQKLTFSLSSTN